MSILIVGGAGYIGSQTAKRVAQAGLEARGVRQPRLRAQVGGQVGPARRGRPRRRRADQARARAARGDGGRALRRLRLRGRVGDQPAQVLPQQRRRHAQPARRDARRGRARHRVLVDVRDLRRAGARADRRARIPRRPAVNPYGETKLAIERALHWYQRAYSLRFAALRYFNAAGADPDGEIGEDHDPGDAPHPARDRGGAGRQGASRSSAPTTRRPTERRSATTSTCRIWPTRTSRRWTSCAAAPPACSSTSARAAGTRCAR